MAHIPHLAVPFRVARDGSAATVEQDSEEEIAQSVRVLLATRPGDRPAVTRAGLPGGGYGTPDPLFRLASSSPGELAPLLAAWEPRARVVDVAQALSAAGVLTRSLEAG